MKKGLTKAQKKEVLPTKTVKRQPEKRSNSKQAKAATAVAEVPETISQPAEQQPAPQTASQAADTATVTPQPESTILQDGTEQAEVATSTDSAKITERIKSLCGV